MEEVSVPYDDTIKRSTDYNLTGLGLYMQASKKFDCAVGTWRCRNTRAYIHCY